MERWIQRPFGQIKRPVTACSQCLGDGVPVSRLLAKDSEKQVIEMSLQDFRPHVSPRYT